MAKRQTTLLQTWGYEGNLPSQVVRDKVDEDMFDDDEEFERAINESEAIAQSEDIFGDDEELERALNESETVLQNEAKRPVQLGPSYAKEPPTLEAGSSYAKEPPTLESGPSHAKEPPALEAGPSYAEEPPVLPSVDFSKVEKLPGFDLSAGLTWIYPTNKSFRSYQFNIVQSCLHNNTLVCLPTGLGKTFIAAVVMYNFYRWYPQGKIVFMAPTKPLVAQQIEACFTVMGIPQEDMMEMTGSVSIRTRVEGWKYKRVFFLTPQVMSNDLSRGLFPAKEVKLMIVDEAHKAQGDYAYCQVARELYRSQTRVRIVALSATPGNDIQAVKRVLQNLYISQVELRHEDSPDILQYTNERRVDKIVVPIGRELMEMKNKLLSVIEIYIKRLARYQAIRQGGNVNSYSKFAILRARDEWRQNPPGAVTHQIKGVVEADFAVVMSLYHGYDLLLQHGMRPFFNFFNKKDEGDFSSKRINQCLGKIPTWRDLLAALTEKFSGDASDRRLNQTKIHLTQQNQVGTQPNLETSHPKIEKLIEIVLEHFQNFERQNLDTRVMIFSQYRDSVNEVVACLSQHSPTIKPMSFVGQAVTLGKKGLTQKEQIEVISRFRNGGYNTLVATCVGEEGLDIGEVDLIVLFDVSKSPIRLVQRMGRTGRKRAGRIVVLVTEGIEERKYNQSLYSKKTINKAILERDKLLHVLYQNAPRMIPEGLEPVCHKMKMVSGEFKPAKSAEGNDKIGAMKKKKKPHRYDKFRQLCGFLTDEDQERWSRDCNYTGSVKKLKEPRELWSGEYEVFSPTKQEPELDLAEYSLWQSDDVDRLYVGSSLLSESFARAMKLIQTPAVLEQTTQKFNESVNTSKSAANSKSVNTSNSNCSKTTNILNYFKPSQAAQEGRDVSIMPIQEEEERLPTNDEDVCIVEDVGMEAVEKNAPTSDQLNPADESLIKLDQISDRKGEPCIINDLLDDDDDYDEDSGFSSFPGSPAFQIDLQELVKNPQKIVEDDGLESAWGRAREKYEHQYLFSSKRYQNFMKLQQKLKMAEQDIFGNSFGKSVMEGDEEDTTKVQNKQERDQINKQDNHEDVVWTQFDLGSPEIIESSQTEDPGPSKSNADPKKLNEYNEDVVFSQFDIGSPVQEIFETSEPEKPDTMKADADSKNVTFDLGSPCIEINSPPQHISPEKPKNSGLDLKEEEFNVYQPQSPIISRIANSVSQIGQLSSQPHRFIKKGRMSTSTPLNYPKSIYSASLDHLTPIKEQNSLHDVSPVLKRRSPTRSDKDIERRKTHQLSSQRRMPLEDIFENRKPILQEVSTGKSLQPQASQDKTKKRLLTEEIFGDSDDDLFRGSSLLGDDKCEENKSKETNASVFGATELVSILNTSPSPEESTCPPRGSRISFSSSQAEKPVATVNPSVREGRRPASSEHSEHRLRQNDGSVNARSRLSKRRLSSVFQANNTSYEAADPTIPDDEPTTENNSRRAEEVWANFDLSLDIDTKDDYSKNSDTDTPEQGKEGNLRAEEVAKFDLSFDLSDDGLFEDIHSQKMEPGTSSRLSFPKPDVKSAAGPNTEEQTTTSTTAEVRTTTCPICGERVVGEDGGAEINSHIDTCLSKPLVEEFSQIPSPQDPGSIGGESNGYRKKTFSFGNAVEEWPHDEESIFKEKSVNLPAVNPQLTSPVFAQKRRLTSSDEDSPIFRRKKSAKVLLPTQGASQVPNESAAEDNGSLALSSSDDFTQNYPRDQDSKSAKRSHHGQASRSAKQGVRRAAVNFLDVSAEVSGSDVSADEAEDDDQFEESFVDDASQEQDDQAMYLRIRGSPTFKDPERIRKIRPITSDIYSQAPEPDAGYEEDSFCVDSDHVEYVSEPDTLDLIEEEASIRRFNKKREVDINQMRGTDNQLNRGQRGQRGQQGQGGPKRRRIVAPENDSVNTDSEDKSTSVEMQSEVRPASRVINLDSEEEDVEKLENESGGESEDDQSTESVSLLQELYKEEQLHAARLSKSSKANNKDDMTHTTETKICSSNHENASIPGQNTPRDTLLPSSTSFDRLDPQKSKGLKSGQPSNSNIYLLKPDLSESLEASEKLSIVIASSEINKVTEIISSLKHKHKLNVVVRQSEVPFIISVRMAVLRVHEAEFSSGLFRKKLEENLPEVRFGYDKCIIIVESEKVKPGDRPKSRNRTKVSDLTAVQLVSSKLQVMYSDNKECTATLLNHLVIRENDKGFGLPRLLKLTDSQEEMLKWLLHLPMIGLGSALHIIYTYSAMRHLVLSTEEELTSAGKLSQLRARTLVQLFSNKFNAETIADLLPVL